MILYHGTPLESGEKIIKEGKIQCQIQRSHEGYKNIIDGTTDGYVYLTQNLYTAYFYGNILLMGQDDWNKKYVYIFKVEIADDKNLLEPDFDELKVRNKGNSKNVTWKESLTLCGCVRIKQDISIKGLEYIKLPGVGNMHEDRLNVEICRKLSSIQIQNGKMNKELEKEIETRWKWNKINE